MTLDADIIARISADFSDVDAALIASPDDFWIAETARSFHKRGYSLMGVESRPATTGPFDYTCDLSEGTAKF